MAYSDGEQSRWDSFGRLAQPLLSSVATVFTSGNHELSSQEAFQGFAARYGTWATGARAPSLWHAETRGSVRVISLCSYCRTHSGSAQFRWLRAELETLTLLRSGRGGQRGRLSGGGKYRDMLVVVQMHAPWYSSSASHHDEQAGMREAMEPLFFLHGVDLVLAGHVHAYERSVPVLDGAPTECAPVHVTIGDAGNREEASTEWRLAPEWSAFRSSSFGFGAVEVHAGGGGFQWTWRRNPHDFFHFPDQLPGPDSLFPDVDRAFVDRRHCHAARSQDAAHQHATPV